MIALSPAAAGAHRLVVSIADAKVSRDPADTLVTYALGSCVAICLFDPAAKVAGMAHVMLPEASMDREKAAANPWMFADTGVPGLIGWMQQQGASGRQLSVHLAGGAQVLNDASLFGIGKRNYAAVRKALWKAGLMVDGEAVGGTISRTVRMDVATGRVWVRENGGAEVEMPLKEWRNAG